MSVHDVAPRWQGQVTAAVDLLAPLVGTTLSAAVVPCRHDAPISPSDTAFVALVRERFDEVLLHGWNHRNDGAAGPVSVVSGGADELTPLDAAETSDRLGRGAKLLREVLGTPGQGFLPPAFRNGAAGWDVLRPLGLLKRVGFARIEHADGRTVPITTWCWDVSDVGALGLVGELAGHALAAVRPTAVPCIAVHPRDVARGFLPRVERVVHSLLERGLRPALVRDLARPREAEGDAA